MKLAEVRERATVTVEEAGRILGVSRGVAYHAASTGELPVVRLGRRILVPVPRLLSLLVEDHGEIAEGGKT